MVSISSDAVSHVTAIETVVTVRESEGDAKFADHLRNNSTEQANDSSTEVTSDTSNADHQAQDRNEDGADPSVAQQDVRESDRPEQEEDAVQETGDEVVVTSDGEQQTGEEAAEAGAVAVLGEEIIEVVDTTADTESDAELLEEVAQTEGDDATDAKKQFADVNLVEADGAPPEGSSEAALDIVDRKTVETVEAVVAKGDDSKGAAEEVNGSDKVADVATKVSNVAAVVSDERSVREGRSAADTEVDLSKVQDDSTEKRDLEQATIAQAKAAQGVAASDETTDQTPDSSTDRKLKKSETKVVAAEVSDELQDEVSSPSAADSAKSTRDGSAAESETQVVASAAADGQADGEVVVRQSGSKFSAHMLGRAQDSAAAERTVPIDQTKFLQRVVKAVDRANAQGEALRLRLHPPELGMLRLEVKLQGNVMTAKLEAETNMARTALMDNLPVLRERLAEQGVRIDQFDVDLMQRGREEVPDQESSQQGQKEGRDAGTTDDSVTASADEVTIEQSRSQTGDDTGLNVFV